MNTTSMLRLAAGALAFAPLLVSSCDEYPAEEVSGPEPPKLRISIESGDRQTERTGRYLPERIVVLVSDAHNNPRQGEPVHFTTDDPGAEVSPNAVASDGNGLASCALRLGTAAGEQHVLAYIADDSVTVAAAAQAVQCDEEATGLVCRRDDRIAIATTSSSLLSLEVGSVILEFDPATRLVSKILETDEQLEGLSYSPKGELFATAFHKVFKVNRTAGTLESFMSYDEDWHLSIEPNLGGVLAGVCEGGPLAIGCPLDGLHILLPPQALPNLQWENVAVDGDTRDIFVIVRFRESNYRVWRIYWDGRTSVQTFGLHADLIVGDAEPRGMCSDSTGTIYVVFDGNGDYRRIVSVAPDGAPDYDFFDFLARAGGDASAAGRWGDIACLGDRLYLVDRRNNRLAVISTSGEWLGEVVDTAFSAPLDESEHYAIAATRIGSCAAAKER